MIDEEEQVNPSRAAKIKSIVLDKKQTGMGPNPIVDPEPRLKPLHMAEAEKKPEEKGEELGKKAGEFIGDIVDTPGQWRNEKGGLAPIKGIGEIGGNIVKKTEQGTEALI